MGLQLTLLLLFACGGDSPKHWDCDEVVAYFDDDTSNGDADELINEQDGFDSSACYDTDPDVVDVTSTWWSVCGDYYDAGQRLDECCPQRGFPKYECGL